MILVFHPYKRKHDPELTPYFIYSWGSQSGLVITTSRGRCQKCWFAGVAVSPDHLVSVLWLFRITYVSFYIQVHPISLYNPITKWYSGIPINLTTLDW